MNPRQVAAEFSKMSYYVQNKTLRQMFRRRKSARTYQLKSEPGKKLSPLKSMKQKKS